MWIICIDWSRISFMPTRTAVSAETEKNRNETRTDEILREFENESTNTQSEWGAGAIVRKIWWSSGHFWIHFRLLFVVLRNSYRFRPTLYETMLSSSISAVGEASVMSLRLWEIFLKRFRPFLKSFSFLFYYIFKWTKLLNETVTFFKIKNIKKKKCRRRERKGLCDFTFVTETWSYFRWVTNRSVVRTKPKKKKRSHLIEWHQRGSRRCSYFLFLYSFKW